MYRYLLIFTTCLNVDTEVQCTAVPSTLTLWMETKWSNPLLIRNLRWHADVTGIYKGKNKQIYQNVRALHSQLGVNICIFIPWSILILSPPPPRNSQHSTESACLSIKTPTWFRLPDTYILDLKHHWSRIQFAEF